MAPPEIHGSVDPKFEGVRRAFHAAMDDVVGPR